MEYQLCSLESALPCEVTIDEDNGRYMIRKADTSGEIFNSAEELILWVKTNWRAEEFCYPEEFQMMMEELDSYQLL